MTAAGDDSAFQVRVAEFDDAAGIGRVQIASLRGLPVDFDDSPGDEEGPALEDDEDGFADIRAAAFWADVIESTENVVLVAILPAPPQGDSDKREKQRDHVAGFIAFGPPRDLPDPDDSLVEEMGEIPPIDAEIYALHVEPAYRGHGMGRRLMASAFRAMAAIGQLAVRAWAVSSNSEAESFYLYFGGTPSLQAVARIGEAEIPETAYDWVDIRRVIPRLDKPGNTPSPQS